MFLKWSKCKTIFLNMDKLQHKMSNFFNWKLNLPVMCFQLVRFSFVICSFFVRFSQVFRKFFCCFSFIFCSFFIHFSFVFRSFFICFSFNFVHFLFVFLVRFLFVFIYIFCQWQGLVKIREAKVFKFLNI